MTRAIAIGMLCCVAGCNSPAKGVESGAEPSATASAAASVPASASASAAASAPASASASASAPASASSSAASASASAPASASASAGLVTSGGAAVSVSETDADKTFDVKPNATVTLSLGANPTTGFDWEVTKAPAAMGTAQRGFTEGGSAPGSPGKRTIVWTVKGALPAGDHAVELAYRRSFEEGKAPFKTFKFKVRGAK